jgi:hypothetical protein
MRRPGVTLTEVLIAIFVMAIGMISLLAMFPIGIQNMLGAMQDNRIAQAAGNAESVAEFLNIRVDPAVAARFQSFAGAVNPNLPSPPLFVDAIGNEVFANPPNPAPPVGAINAFAGIPRTGVSFANTLGVPRRWFSLEDEITFDTGGLPVLTRSTPTDPPLLERDRRYSWAYLCRRPRFSEPNIVELTIVLFNGRRLQRTSLLNPTGEVTLLGPGGGPVFTAGSATATVSLAQNGGQPAPIKTGEWILDATVRMGTQGANFTDAIFNGYFYRVVGVSEVYQHASGEQCQDFELQTPARANGFVAVFMTGVADVIEKNDGRMP